MFVNQPKLPKKYGYIEVIDEHGEHVYKKLFEEPNNASKEIEKSFENSSGQIKELEESFDILVDDLV